jgi:hypothetical protein
LAAWILAGALGCRLRRVAEPLWITLTKRQWISAVALGLLFPTMTWAQAARDYMNTPVNAGSFFLDFVHTRSETASASDLPLPNNLTVSRVRAATILYSFPLAGRYGGIGLTVGHTRVQGTGSFGDIETSGFTDPGITFHANIFGAPALLKEDFAQAIPQSFSSFHITVNPPLGSYDRNAPVNTGTNRWTFHPSLSLSLTRNKGVSWVDLYGGVRFFTNNNEFQGSSQLSQKPLAILSAHYSHNIGKRMYAAIGVNYDRGGETSVNHIGQDNTANGFRPGVAISRLIWKFRATLRYELTASTPSAAPSNGLLSLRISGMLF